MPGRLSTPFTTALSDADTGPRGDTFRFMKQALANAAFWGTSFAPVDLRHSAFFNHKKSNSIMVSAWWLLWAFVVGGYAGMLLVALVAVARKNAARDSAFE